MISVILCAAGSGTRANLPENKILHDLNGMPVLCHSLSAFAPYADEILVACRKEDEPRVLPLLAPYPQARAVLGGATRTDSVYAVLQKITGDIVLIHDAARPFVTPKVIEDCIASVEAYGSGVCALPATDTVVLTENGYRTPKRDGVFTVQTPQGFRTAPLLAAYERAMESGEAFTDDSGIYARFAEPPHLFLGDPANKKLTYIGDFSPAERVGFGVDTHAFAHQDEIDRGIARLNLNYITLCGVVIASDRALEAHSDGDVPVHALMDALLSAIGERDIGFHFPDTDPVYKDADSMALLARVMQMVEARGFFVKNASVTILCERPRLSPHIEKMRENLRRALRTNAVAVAAGTNEKLGYIGEGKGVTACATVLLGAQGKTP